MREALISRKLKQRNRLQLVDLDDAVSARCRVSDIPEEHARAILSRNLTQDAGGIVSGPATLVCGRNLFCGLPKAKLKH